MKLNKSTFSEQVYQLLREDILTQRIPLGEKLTLKTLKERFEVSSTPIREALTRLSQDGLVDYYSNVGMNVINIQKNDLIELFQFMGDLDGLAISYAKNYPHQEEILARLRHVLSITREIQNQGMPEDRISEWIENSDQFHLIFYDFCQNNRLKTAAEKLRSQLTIFSNIYETQLDKQIEISRMHEQIFDAYCNKEYNLAARLMKKHLETSLQYALEAYENL